MSDIIGDEPCPECRKNGHDSTGNHLIVFSDGGKYCNRCGYGVNSGVLREIEEDINVTDISDIKKLPSATLKDRHLNKSTLEHYGVKVSVSGASGEIDSHYYPIVKDSKVTGYKVRELPKKMYTQGDSKGAVELFGQKVTPSGGKKLVITEGELDALSVYQMLYKNNPKWPHAVVSLPFGAKAQAVADNLEFVNSFEEVLVYTDMDDAGKAVAEDIAKLVGAKAKVITTTEKDASDMLVKGKSKEFINAFWNAKEYAPDGFVTVDDVWEEATAMPTWGRPWPWPTLTKKTYGRRGGEGLYLGAGAKMGKSEFVNQYTDHCIREDEGLALFKLEETPPMTVRKVAGKLKHKQFHKPDGDFTQEELIEGVQSVKDSGVIFYGKYGTNRWGDVEPAIRYAVHKLRAQGRKFINIVIDPLTRLVDSDPSVANMQLTEISDSISKLAKDLDFFYIICTHLNAPKTGKPHEEGGKVHSNQFTGSRSMMRACYYMLGIERDKSADDEAERNTSQFVLLEDRAFGLTGKFDVFYNQSTGDYLEPERTFGTKEDY